MSKNAFLDRMRRCARDLRTANGANVTVTFALATIPMVGFVGAAVDYSHANSVKAAMQAAADSTALMLSKSAASLSSAQLQTKANDYFKAVFNRPEATGLTVTATYVSTPSSQVKINATSNVKTNFMNLMGFASLKVGVDSQVKWGNVRLRVALALDTTGSMDDDGKIEALKTATKSLLNQLKSAAQKDGDVYVSIIPFSKDVNVGKSNYTQNWVRWDLWEENNGNCKDYDGWIKPQNKNSCKSKNGNWTPDSKSSWNGCVTDRDKDYDTKNTAPVVGTNATLFPAEQYDSCPAQMMGLTYDWNALSSKVDGLYPAGMTNQNIGVAWALQSLTAAPFTVPAKDANYKYSEVIILMSDGLNTESRFSGNQSDIDAREQLACTNAKNAGMIIYAVQVNTGGDPTQSVMKNCASSTDKFVEIKQANQLVTVFNSIGTALSNLRIAE
jgi:Flp pilus assembly protein TadG